MDSGLVGTVLQLMQETVTNDTALQAELGVQMSRLESAKSLRGAALGGSGAKLPWDCSTGSAGGFF